MPSRRYDQIPTKDLDVNRDNVINSAELQVVAQRFGQAGGWGTLYRDPYAQPFSEYSIWNTPIGSGATFLACPFTPIGVGHIKNDENVICLFPAGSSRVLRVYNADPWERDGNGFPVVNRCSPGANTVDADDPTVPVPNDLLVEDERPNTPNYASTILKKDGRTFLELQPFSRCSTNLANVYYHSRVDHSDEVAGSMDIYGMGFLGSHGGSGLPGLGGCIRKGELVPNKTFIPHVLKIELWAEYFYSNAAPGYVWPASAADSGWDVDYGSLGSPVAGCQPGALMALETRLGGLTTEPARILAETLYRFGAYIVDSSSEDAFNICTERSVAGAGGNNYARVEDEFLVSFGFAFDQYDLSTNSWTADILAIFAALKIVTNNGQETWLNREYAGGGSPRSPRPLVLG